MPPAAWRSAPTDDARLRPALLRAFGRLVDLVLGTRTRRRIHVIHWSISVSVYASSALALGLGGRDEWLHWTGFLGWCVFSGLGQSAIYVAIRSGWSERFADPALTAVQMVLALLAVGWAYMICGPMRGVALLPLLLIFTFGAFALSWRRFAWLTLFALACLVAVVVALNTWRSGPGGWSFDNGELRIDLINVTMVGIMLPAISVVSARLSSLRSRLRQQREELTRALKEVQRLATRDDLTGLANRRHIQERLVQEHGRVGRGGRPFSVALIDIDHFKRINDSHGHASGDDVLRAFAAEAAAMLRSCDLMARWGGEEFLLLLPDTQAPQARASVERLLARIREVPLATGFPLTFSAGVAEFQPGEMATATVARADRAMYAAKEGGRNRVVLQ